MTSLITKTHPATGLAFTFRDDGWFNMTKAAAHFGKELKKFWEVQETADYVSALESQFGQKQPIKDATKGRYGGTWAHPKLAVFFARWLDVRFAVWCDAMIEDILKGNAEVTITKPEQSYVMALPQDYSTALRALADGWEREQKAQVEAKRLTQVATALKAIESMRSNLRGSAAAMERDGLTKEQIKDIFLQFANSL